MSLQLVKTFLAMASKENHEGARSRGSWRMRMYSILTQLKDVGAELDKEHRVEMDRVQEKLIKLCQDREVDTEIRLMMLEIIELRALGWKADENSRKYYEKQLIKIRAAKEQAKSPEPPAPAPSQQNRSPPPANLPERQHSPEPPQSPESEEQVRVECGNEEEEEDSVIKEHLSIGNFKLVLKCSDRQVLQLSKQQLYSFFKSRNEIKMSQDQEGPEVRINYLAAKPPAPPTIKYSREEILMISENPQSKAQPLDWSEKKKKLPGAILKSRPSSAI